MMKIHAVLFVALHICALLLLCLASGVSRAAEPSAPANGQRMQAGPVLETIPLVTVDRSQLPAPATWPARNRTHRLRILALKDHGMQDAPYYTLGHWLGTHVNVTYYSPMFGQSADFLLTERAGFPKEEDLVAYLHKLSSDAVAVQGKTLPADVIFLTDTNAFNDAAMQAALLAYANAGGILVVCGNLYPKADSPFAAVWPAAIRKNANGDVMNTWYGPRTTREAGPELAGVPVRLLSAWAWIPLASATPGARALANGEAGASFLRKIGDGALIFSPVGPLTQTWDAVAYSSGPSGFDHAAIWLRYWEQLLYELVDGAKAFPAYTDLQLKTGADKKAEPGAVYPLVARYVNRTWTGPLVSELHVTDYTGKVVFTREERVELAAGRQQEVEIGIPVDASWPAGKYAVALTLGDPTGKTRLHQSLEYVDVAGALQLALASDKRTYRYGETAQFTLTASGLIPWKGKVQFGVYDYRGRLLSMAAQDVSLDGDTQTVKFPYRMLDHGVKVDTFRALVSAVSAGKEWGRAECKFGLGERWSARNEYQWSSWGGAAPALVQHLPGMRLNAFAGQNALGFIWQSEMTWPAERWGWRVYNEGIVVNTFSPVIEYENDQEIEAAFRKQALDARKAGLSPANTSPAFVYGSIAEEGGFGSGWGRKYYWDTPVAPEKACRAFQWYLKTRYDTLDELNAAWRTAYTSWDEVQLTKRLSGNAPKPLLSGGAVDPTDLPAKAVDDKGSFVPYLDTSDFYRWYYDKIVAVAVRVFHEEVNPRTLTTVSTGFDGFMSPEVDIISTPVASQYNEIQWNGQLEQPGFGLCAIFPYDDDWGARRAIVGHTHGGSTHVTAYMGLNAHFNQDLTLGRGAMALRRWMAQVDGRTRILLDRTLPDNGVGVLSLKSRTQPTVAANMTKTVTVSLQQAGYGYRDITADAIDGRKIIFAPQAFVAGDAVGKSLSAHVRNGGVLVLFPGFFSETDKAVRPAAIPGAGLSAAWGLTVTPGNYHEDSGARIEASLDSVAPALKGARLSSASAYRDRITAPEWTVRATYGDGVPAVLSRTIGTGTVFYVNAFYASHHYIQLRTPTDAARQGFYRLMEWLCEQSKAVRTYRVDGDLQETLLPAHTQFTDPTGRIHYVVMATSWGIPWVHGTLTPLGAATSGYDVLARMPGEPSPRLGATVPFQQAPCTLRLLAFLEKPVKTVRVQTTPARITAGQPFTVTASILDAANQPIPGQFPLELRAFAPDGKEIMGLRRDFSLRSGEKYTVQTALNDPAGACRLVVTESISGLAGMVPLQVAPVNLAASPGFRALGWASDLEANKPISLSSEDFVQSLHALRDLYQREYTGMPPWQARYYLSYYTECLSGGRHDLAVRLSDVDWWGSRTALTQALANGDTLILTGEDVNIDPATGLRVYPHYDGRQLAALADVLRNARWYLGTADGDTLVAVAGKGRVVLWRESLDAPGTEGAPMLQQLTRWQQELAATGALTKEAPGKTITALTAAELYNWWSGRRSAGTEARRITWLGDNQRELTVKIDPARDALGTVFLLKLPPTGAVTSATLSIATTGDAPVSVAVGANGESRQLTAGAVDWTQAINAYLAWCAQSGAGLARDDNNWRVIPVRLTADKPATVMVTKVLLQVR